MHQLYNLTLLLDSYGFGLLQHTFKASDDKLSVRLLDLRRGNNFPILGLLDVVFNNDGWRGQHSKLARVWWAHPSWKRFFLLEACGLIPILSERLFLNETIVTFVVLNEYLEIGFRTDNLRCVCNRRTLCRENLAQSWKHITALSHRLPHETNLRVVVILHLM
jgi:hypothetical protein